MRLSILAAFVSGSLLLGVVPVWAKTAKECNAEYKANKNAIQPTQKKADFMTACRAGTEAIPSAVAPAPASPAPPPSPAQTAAPAPAPTPAVPTPKPARATRAAPAEPALAGAATHANQFSVEGEAKARCPGATVVWVNTNSRIYHFAGTKNYGTTKSGAYMCETDATAAGDRASMTEKHP